MNLIATLHDIDRTERHCGMIPVSAVRARLGDAADALLIEADDTFAVSLKIANDPARLSAAERLETTRGTAFAVVVR